MNAVAQEVGKGHYVDDMPNDSYHQLNKGISTSNIKDFISDPSLVVWSENAEKDESKLSAIDFGTDFHLYFLESDAFDARYQILPAFNRRKPAEKQEELDLIAQWRERGVVPITNEDMNKAKAMRESALAHPTLAAIMALDGIAERSYFWTDPKTGVNCKCRPDWIVLDIDDTNRPPFMPSDCTTLVFDLKTIANIDRIQNQIEELKYYVQDAFYTRGIEYVTGTKVCFVFGFVSTSLSLGRYPTRVVVLADTAKFDGNKQVNDALTKYADMMAGDESIWQTAITMDRPAWATRDDDIY